MLLVRGPSVFGGYLHYDGPSPFVPYAGKQWYRTGDLVSEDSDGVLTFCGRLKRFVKIGGEMIPLPAIEAALEAKLQPAGSTDGPCLAVESTADEEHPELVLFTTLAVDREAANRCLRESGLSPLHNIRRVVHLETLPLLGTGKTDYRSLKALLGDGKNPPQ
jgi:long-chain-fatty-acid--[acyl-carrier-protein] ligase